MAAEWRDVLLEQVAEDVTVGHVGPMAAEYVPNGVPFLRSQNVERLRINDSDLKFITPAFHERLKKSALAPGDVVIVRTGKPGACCVVPETLPVANCSDLVIVRCGPQLDPHFFAYYVNSAAAHHVNSHLVGAVQQHFNVGSARKLSMRLPELPEQRAIAHILGTLDDKIELNRRMNETLEAMARAIFQSWFVDFDPVRAKAEGRAPGLPKAIAHLFPDCFEDSALGGIPAGWEMGRLGDVLEQRVERCDASTETAARSYVPIDCISSKSLFLTEGKPGEEAQSSLTRFYKGDLLFGAMRPYFHKVCIAPFDGTTRTTAFVLFPRTRGDFAFATLLLHHPDTIDYATRHSTGSTIPYAVWSNSLEDMPVIVPPSAVREVFDGIVRPVLDRIPEPYFETKTLAALRDALLPKLTSGELRVTDVEHIAASDTLSAKSRHMPLPVAD